MSNTASSVSRVSHVQHCVVAIGTSPGEAAVSGSGAAVPQLIPQLADSHETSHGQKQDWTRGKEDNARGESGRSLKIILYSCKKAVYTGLF